MQKMMTLYDTKRECFHYSSSRLSTTSSSFFPSTVYICFNLRISKVWWFLQSSRGRCLLVFRLFGQSCHMHRHRLLGKKHVCPKGPAQNQASKVFQQVPDKVMRNGSNAVLHLTVQNLIPRTKRNRKWLQKEKRNMNIFMPGKLIACSAWNIIAR